MKLETSQIENLIELAENKVISLADLKLIPLSTQLYRITGDFYNNEDYRALDPKLSDTAAGQILCHLYTGLKFLITA